MGTWSHDAFGNDSACDWAYGLEDQDDLSLVNEAIAGVLQSTDDYLDASLATDALAAIEVLARLRGHFGFTNAYTEVADKWVLRTRLNPSDELVGNALAALERIIGDDSELKELWQESDDEQTWIASVQELRARLLAKPRPVSTEALAAIKKETTSVSKPSTADACTQIVDRISKIEFAHPTLSPDASLADLHRAIMIGGALCDVGVTRQLIARIWQPLANLEKESVLWDLAVREAQTWALEGHLDEALVGLEDWRSSPAATGPSQFDMRATTVCLLGHDLERARAYSIKTCAAAPDNAMWRIDRALLEARLGSAEVARDILAKESLDTLPASSRLGVTLIEGILACRHHEPAALNLMSTATHGFLAIAETTPAAWSLLSICCGWWALALGEAGQTQQAVALLHAIKPILLQPYNRDLVIALKENRLLAGDTLVPSFPVAPVPNSATIKPSTAVTDHGPFKTIRVRGVNALQRIEVLRREFAQGSRLYPFLIGDENELTELLEQLLPPADGGRAHLEQARQFDVSAWLKEHMPKPVKSWPKQTLPAQKTPLSQYYVLNQELKPEIVIGLIELDDPGELFARIGYGDWNDCPAPHIHTALHAYWHKQYGAEPIAISGSVVECIVARPPTEKPAALNLAREHHGYCYDIVEQGTGTTAKLASSLLEAKYWYFWWD